MNPRLVMRRGFFDPSLVKDGVLLIAGRWPAVCFALLEFCVRVSRTALQSCPTPGLRGRLFHGRLLHSASASTSPELSGFGPSPAEWLARSFPRLLERHRSNLCNAARDRTEQTVIRVCMSNRIVADAVQQKEALVNREEGLLFSKLAIC